MEAEGRLQLAVPGSRRGSLGGGRCPLLLCGGPAGFGRVCTLPSISRPGGRGTLNPGPQAPACLRLPLEVPGAEGQVDGGGHSREAGAS